MKAFESLQDMKFLQQFLYEVEPLWIMTQTLQIKKCKKEAICKKSSLFDFQQVKIDFNKRFGE